MAAARVVCSKCRGWVQVRDIHVLDNQIVTTLVSCILCGHIMNETVKCSAPRRPLEVSTFVHPGVRTTCRNGRCTAVHYKNGFCFSHWQADYNRRAKQAADEYNRRVAG